MLVKNKRERPRKRNKCLPWINPDQTVPGCSKKKELQALRKSPQRDKETNNETSHNPPVGNSAEGEGDGEEKEAYQLLQ